MIFQSVENKEMRVEKKVCRVVSLENSAEMSVKTYLVGVCLQHLKARVEVLVLQVTHGEVPDKRQVRTGCTNMPTGDNQGARQLGAWTSTG